jgi:hypothetical protein
LGILGPIVFPRLRSLPGIVIVARWSRSRSRPAKEPSFLAAPSTSTTSMLNVIGVAVAYLLAGRRIAALVRGRAAT